MKNRLVSFLLVFLLIISLIPSVQGASFPDIKGHWAEEYIEETVSAGLFNGMEHGMFEPGFSMTRGMFVTVLGRYEGIDEVYWSAEHLPDFFSRDVAPDAYYAPYIRWAVCNGIADGISSAEFAPDIPVTREQMAKIIHHYIGSMGHTLLPADDAADIPESFADAAEISAWAGPSVKALRESGILNGIGNEDGTVSFQPLKTATRAEAATVFCRLASRIEKNSVPAPEAESISISPSEASLKAGESCQLTAGILPENASVRWRSSNAEVAAVDENGLVTCISPGKADVTVFTGNGLFAVCHVACGHDYPGPETTDAEKSILLFGKVVENPRDYYTDSETASANMEEITVRTWDIRENGEKYTRNRKIKVHKNLAPTVKAIFEEIYNGEEKFPICYLSGYAGYVGSSEHSIGTAIDINFPQNYYCDPQGNAIVGDYWKPGEDPYSIVPGGDVDRAFSKYGFTWGIYWRSGYKDYMHFSFFGT